MLDLFNMLLDQIGQYAYLGIAVMLLVSVAGVPLPEDLVVIATGVMAERGAVELLPAWLTVYFAILLADAVTFHIGWYFGHAVVHRRWVKRILHPRRVFWARRQIHEHGAWGIAAARFIPGSRSPVLIISGMMHIKRWKWLLADASTLVVTSCAQLAVGWLLSKSIDRLAQQRTILIVIFIAIGVSVILAYAAYRKWWKPRTA